MAFKCTDVFFEVYNALGPLGGFWWVEEWGRSWSQH